MPNYVTKISKSGGGTFNIMDKEARDLIVSETEAMEESIGALESKIGTINSTNEFFVSNLFAHAYHFQKNRSYEIKIRLVTPFDSYTSVNFSASTGSGAFLTSADLSDIVETVVSAGKTVTIKDEIDVAFTCSSEAMCFIYYLGSSTVRPHTITINDVTDIDVGSEYSKIPLTLHRKNDKSFGSMLLYEGIEYTAVLTNVTRSAEKVFEFTACEDYSLSAATLERIFGGVVSRYAYKVAFRFRLNSTHQMIVTNYSSPSADFTYEVFCSESDYLKAYGEMAAFKRLCQGTEADIGSFYGVHDVNFEAGERYVFRFKNPDGFAPTRLAFSTADEDGSSYTLVEEGIFDVSGCSFGDDYYWEFTASENAESLMLLISGINGFIADLYIYKHNRENGRFQYYVNPVFKKRDTSDPTVWKGDDGYFYCLGSPWSDTTYGILRSADLVEWENTGVYPFDSSVTSLFSEYTYGVWACQCIKIGEYWMMYISLYAASHQVIAVCRSRNPFGKFTLLNVLTDSEDTGINDTIDPFVTIGEDNKVYLFFGSTGKVHRLQLTDDGTEVAEGSTPVHVAGTTDQSDNREKVFEGTYLYFRNGYWYMFVSSGTFNTYHYKLKVGRAVSITDDFVDKNGNSLKNGNASVILSSGENDSMYGPGHNGEIYTDTSGRDFMVFHCHDKPSEYMFSYGDFSYLRSRMLFIQEIKWDADGWPYFEGNKPASKGESPYM